MIRRFGPPVLARQTYRPRPGAYAILWNGSDLLLTHQGGDADEFQLPGGGIDPGESPLRALHREVMEETGWRLSGPRLLHTYRRFVFMPDYDIWAEKICHIYLARPSLRHGDPIEPDHTPVWMSPLEASTLLANSGDRTSVRQVFRLWDR